MTQENYDHIESLCHFSEHNFERATSRYSIVEEQSSRSLSRAIKAALQEDRQKQAAEAGSEMESLLASNPPLILYALIWMQGWYKAAVD